MPERVHIGFCVTNVLTHGQIELLLELKSNGYDVETADCLNHCGDCRKSPYCLIEGEKFEYGHRDKLLERIAESRQVEHNERK